MILRDAIFSAERHHLGAKPASTGLPEAPVRLDVEVRDMPARYEAHSPEPPPLSSDHVVSWLVTQDGATRTALAAMLSEELAAVREAARAEGYERGHQEAMSEARETVRSSLAALEQINAAAEAAFAAEMPKMISGCADVVAEVFFKLAGEALVSREAIVGVVGEVIKRVREERELRIHVNPADLAVLRTAEAGIAASLPGRRFTLLADTRVETGGCMVESALGSLDGRLEVQLAGLCDALRAAKAGGEA